MRHQMTPKNPSLTAYDDFILEIFVVMVDWLTENDQDDTGLWEQVHDTKSMFRGMLRYC